jgi:CBS domain-containing protein
MLVSEVMSTTLEFVAPDATVQAAAVLMGELEVGALPVGSSGDLQGVITDRDIFYRVVAEGRSSADVRVRQVMTSTVFTCSETDTLAQAIDLMGAYHVRRLPVLNATGALSGWITLTDVSRVMLQESGAIAAALEEISAPERAA